MTSPILPSTHRRPTPEQAERELPDLEAEEVHHPASRVGISATTLSRASHCLLRAVWASRGEKGIAPSPFTQASFEDGKAFENDLFDEHALWVRAINQALETTLPENLPVIKCTGVKPAPGEPPAGFVGRAQEALAAVLPADRTQPFALTQVTLASTESDALLQGQPDLLLWTGSEWLISDVKCSEEARRSHGIQISAYARMLRAMRPDEPIHSQGVVIHCANGYRYTAGSTPAEKQITLQHTQATGFPLATFRPVLEEFLTILTAPGNAPLDRALREAVFSPGCNECEFRHRCYPRFLESRHVSLVPLLKAELDALMKSGITTIDDLIAAIDSPGTPAHQSLLDLKDDSPLQLRFLREKAECVLQRGLYSSWRAARTSLTNPLFFVSVGDESLFDPVPTDTSTPSCLVVYSEGERRRAWGKLLAIRKDWKMPTFVLSKEVQESLHGPLPSITLRPLAAILNGKIPKTFDYFQTLYPGKEAENPDRFQKILQEETTPTERMRLLKIVWNFLQTAALPFSLDPPTQP